MVRIGRVDNSTVAQSKTENPLDRTPVVKQASYSSELLTLTSYKQDFYFFQHFLNTRYIIDTVGQKWKMQHMITPVKQLLLQEILISAKRVHEKNAKNSDSLRMLY